MKKCKACQKQIDDKAKKCPHCQTDLRNWILRHPILSGIISIVILIVFISAAGSDQKSTKTTPNQPAQQEEIIKVESLKINTLEFIEEFDKNQLAAEEKYEGKLVEFTAVIDNISEDILATPFLSLKPSTEKFYAGTSIKCSFKDKSELTAFENGQTITLQGTVETQSLGIIAIKDCREL